MVMPKCAAMAVGAAFRFEGPGHWPQFRSKASEHIPHDMVLTNKDAIMVDLGRGMPIADMPSQPR